MYRRWRPKKLSEVVGQEHVVTTLTNALKNGNVRHAYLFTGPRGVGKTTVARILAHEINELEYTDESTHLDIIEIDAASNRRIDEIRDLRDKVHITPTSAKYKVYIIDEVHMLTREAFNALLKTLEEPPEHAIFILATTELHKVPATIISRTQRFPFRQISSNDMKAHLKKIANAEKIDIDDEAIDKIVTYGEGSARDSISLLDQISSSKRKINKAEVESSLGLPADEQIKLIIDHLQAKDISGIIATINQLTIEGVSANQAATSLAKHLRAMLLDSTNLNKRAILNLLRELLSLNEFADPMAALEIALIEAASPPDSSAPNDYVPPNHETSVEQDSSKENQALTSGKDEAQPETETKPQTESPNESKASKDSIRKEKVPPELPRLTNSAKIDFDWLAVLNSAKTTHGSLYGMLRMASARLEGDNLYLSFAFPFHAKQAGNSKNNAKLLSIINDLGYPVSKIEIEPCQPESIDQNNFELAEPIKNEESEIQKNDEIETISNIFGGAELLD